MFSHQRFVERFLHAPPKIDMTDARGLLQEAAVIATSPITAPAPADHAATQLTAPSGSAPNFPLDSSSTNPFYVNSHFSPTMIIILVILLSAFLFMALFAVYVRRCTSDEGLSWRGNSRRMSRRDDSNNMGCGVDPLLVESYPIVSYAVAKKKGCYECPVCLSEFEGGDELKQLPKCKHVFHPGCIGLWLESHTTCPLCRRSLVNSDRWSMSFRWGGSSRGSSLSTRHNGQESSRSRRSGETASARLGRAGSSTGWHGRNEDASSRGCVQHETGLRVIDASSSSELESQGLPTSNSLAASDRLSEGVRRGLPASPLASEGVPPGRTESVLSNLWPHGIQAACVSSDLMPHEIQECTVSTELMMPRGYQSSEVAGRGQHGSRESSELATNAASELAKGEGKKPRQAATLQGRRKLSRSNSTGHSLRRRAVLQTTGCILPFSLHRSRSVGVDGLDEEEGMVGPACATSEHSLESGSGCTSHIPRQPCHDSTSASPPSEK